MADNITSFKCAAVREKILEALRIDLMGPQEECEVLNEKPTDSYITGMLYPSDTSFSENETYDDQEFMQCHLVKPVSTGFTAVLNFRNRYTYVTQNLKNVTFPIISDS